MLARVFFLSISIALRSISATFLLIGVAFAAESVTADPVDFQISEQPLNSALNEFARQSDREIFYASDVVDGVHANAVNGKYEPEDALELLLSDSGLEYSMTASDTFLVNAEGGNSDSKNSSPAPFLMAQNQTSPVQTASSRSDDDKSRDSAEGAATATPLEEIIVVGTNIRGVENPTVPVLTFDREDIALSGATTVDDFLRTIPQNFASETQLTANSGNPFTSGRNRSQGTSIDLRGLGGGSTLVLLNGRRLPFSGDAAIVDVNAIPLGAIERVEILTDGATALYGSDAVGGVINFITRDTYKGLDVNVLYGMVTDGSKEELGYGAAGGFGWGSGSFFGGVDYLEEKPLLIEERDFINIVPPRDGATLGSDAERLGVSGNIKQEVGSKLHLGVSGFYSETASASFSADPGDVQTFNESEQTSLSINPSIEYDITDRITALFFTDITRNRTDATSTETLSGTVRRSAFDNDLTVYEGRISGEAVNLPGGPVSFSLGGLYRSEEFSIPDTANTVGSSGERDITAGYGELLVPVLGEGNSLPLIQKFSVSLAGRYEDYSDFGDTFDPKIGLFWEVNDELSFRASYSEAFRAPDLRSLNDLQTLILGFLPEFFFTAVAPDESPVSDPFGGSSYIYAASFGGNPDLMPERAETWSAGFSFEPSIVSGLTIEGNFFDITYTDRLESIPFGTPVQNSAFSGLVDVEPELENVQAIFDRAAEENVLIVNFFGFSPEDVQVLFDPNFTNVAEREVRGFDLTINYIADTDFGRFATRANATYLIDYVGRLTELSPPIDELNTLYRPVNLKLRGDISWSKGGFTAFTAVNYVDGYRDNIDRSVANGIDAWTTIDLSLSYETETRLGNAFTDGVRFGINVNNLFDNDPPFVMTPFGLNFDSANATPWGRQVSFTISKSF